MFVYSLLILAGLLTGVLVNALADDLPMRLRPGGLRCRKCGTAFPAIHWPSILHFVPGGGRCPTCQCRRSIRHVWVEVAAILGMLFLWWRSPDLARFLPAALILATFLLIAVIDLEHRLILHVVSLPAAGIALIAGTLTPGRSFGESLVGGLAGYLTFFGLYLLGGIFGMLAGRLRGEPVDEVALGGGDVNLAGVVGLLVGWPGVVLALVITVLSGGFVALLILIYRLARRTYTPFMAIPYGPFLILGGLALYLFRPEILAWAQAP